MLRMESIRTKTFFFQISVMPKIFNIRKINKLALIIDNIISINEISKLVIMNSVDFYII